MKYRVILVVSFLVLCVDAFAQQNETCRIQKVYPDTTVFINGMECYIGSTFRVKDTIDWNHTAIEEIYAKNVSTGKLYVFSKAAFEKKGVKSSFEFLQHSSGSSRGTIDIQEGIRNPELFPMRRLALVIGNTNYKWETSLLNTLHDARLVGEKLLSLGFDVISLYDAGYTEFQNNVEYFYKQAEKYDVSLLYYAGHGIQDKGINYLVPCDADLQYASSKNKLISVADLLRQATASDQNNDIFFLDACRDIKPGWSRSANIESNQIEAPSGVSIMYSTGSGFTASDGDADNSPFASAFLSEVGNPGVSLNQTMDNIRWSVLDMTNGSQDPAYQPRLTKPFVFQAKDAPKMYPVLITWDKAPSAVVLDNDKDNASRPISFVIMESKPSKLEIVRETLKFEDDNENSAIDASEACTISFTVSNTGEGDSKDCVASIVINGTADDIHLDSSKKLPVIPSGATMPVTVPIIGGARVKDGKVTITIRISDATSLRGDGFKMTLNTLKGK